MAPSALQPGTRLLDESMSVIDVVESERMSIEGNDAEEEEPAPGISPVQASRSPAASDAPWRRHVDNGVEFVVDAVHRGDASPDLLAGRHRALTQPRFRWSDAWLEYRGPGVRLCSGRRVRSGCVEPAFLLAAFGLGFVAQRISLPPLVGYLVAGFALHGFGYETTAAIEEISDLGVLLLLFAIGLKLKLSTLGRPVVWAGASLHMAVTTAIIGGLFLALGAAGLPLASGLGMAEAALVGFAFSFSSTVFAVKALDERNETTSLQGRIAIGILIVQDIFAVVFLTFAVDKAPSWWAIPVVVGIVGSEAGLWLAARSQRSRRTPGPVGFDSGDRRGRRGIRSSWASSRISARWSSASVWRPILGPVSWLTRCWGSRTSC